MDFFTSVQQKALSLIQQACLGNAEKPIVILGFSGGPDSMFLLHVLRELDRENNIILVAAHFDHEWRMESHADLLFCQNVCEKLGVRFYSGKASMMGAGIKKNGSLEEFGRNLRRAFFSNLMREAKADCVVLAHHLQDQQETFFIRLLRGSSLDGLTGIKPVEGFYVRPLLEYGKDDILTYLDTSKIEYLSDPTNRSPVYLRNRIRMSILPAFNNVDVRFNAKFCTTLRNLNEENKYLESLADQAFTSCFTKPESQGIFVGNQVTFAALHQVLQRRVVLIWLIRSNVRFTPSEGFVEEILRFLLSPRGGRHCINSDCSIEKKKKIFWISHLNRC